ncbi:MAG: hypothetical protein ABI851_02225 [Saprospiraceae bacterium]
MAIVIISSVKKKKNIWIFCFSFIILNLCLFTSCKSTIDEKVPNEVVRQSIEVTFDKLVNVHNYNEFGLSNEGQAKTLTAVTQCKKYFIGLSKIRNYNGTDSIFQLVNKNYSIEIAFQDSMNKIRTSIEYKLNTKDEWEAIGFGYSPIFSHFINDTLLTPLSNLSIVSVPALNTGFYFYRENNTGKLMCKLLNRFKNNYSSSQKTYNDQEILNLLKEYSNNLDSRYPG